MSSRLRPMASAACLVAGGLALLIGALALYANRHLLEAERFADDAVAALEVPAVRDAVATEITVDVLEQIAPNLIAVRPIVEAGTGAVITSAPFESALRTGVAAAHRTVFRGDDDAVVGVANVGVMLTEAVRRFSPELAAEIPPDLDSTILDLSRGAVAVDAAQLADEVDEAARWLTIIALLLLALAVGLATDRRRALVRTGFAVAVVGVALIAIEVLGRTLTGALVAPEHRDASLAIWDVFVRDLAWWGATLAVAGTLIVSAAATALRAFALDEWLRRAWRLLVTEPARPGRRLLWALGLAAVGLLMLLEPAAMIRLAAFLGGIFLLSRALSAVIELVLERFGEPEDSGEGGLLGPERGLIAGLAVAGAAGIAAASVAIGTIPTGDRAPGALAAEGCNGSPELCDRPLDEVAFAATHNSFAGADYPGFVFPEQDSTIAGQLEAGIRGLWVDTYYGIPGRRVYTDTSKIDPALSAQILDELGPRFVESAQRIRSQVARPDGEPRLYFCHGFCELGAVDAVEGFREVADFLDANPNEVVIIDIEDYTTPEDTVAAIGESGLERYVYKGPDGPPWPTLGEMIEAGERVLIVNEHQEGGPDWYRPAYEGIFQETGFAFPNREAMDCEPNRGDPGASLFLINHWIDTDPAPRPTLAERANEHDFLLRRARRCERERGAFPNVVNVDFHGRGDVTGVVDALNVLGPATASQNGAR